MEISWLLINTSNQCLKLEREEGGVTVHESHKHKAWVMEWFE